jgi:hypothetical protein
MTKDVRVPLTDAQKAKLKGGLGKTEGERKEISPEQKNLAQQDLRAQELSSQDMSADLSAQDMSADISSQDMSVDPEAQS